MVHPFEQSSNFFIHEEGAIPEEWCTGEGEDEYWHLCMQMPRD